MRGLVAGGRTVCTASTSQLLHSAPPCKQHSSPASTPHWAFLALWAEYLTREMLQRASASAAASVHEEQGRARKVRRYGCPTRASHAKKGGKDSRPRLLLRCCEAYCSVRQEARRGGVRSVATHWRHALEQAVVYTPEGARSHDEF